MAGPPKANRGRGRRKPRLALAALALVAAGWVVFHANGPTWQARQRPK